MSSVREIRESIQKKVATMDFDLRTLELWEKAEAQGIDSSGGGSFGFDTRMFTLAQRREWYRFPHRFIVLEATGARRLKLYNYFRYPDGRVVGLDPLLEAVNCE